MFLTFFVFLKNNFYLWYIIFNFFLKKQSLKKQVKYVSKTILENLFLYVIDNKCIFMFFFYFQKNKNTT